MTKNDRQRLIQLSRIKLIDALFSEPRKELLPLHHFSSQLVDQVEYQFCGLVKQNVLNMWGQVLDITLELQLLKIRKPQFNVIRMVVANQSGNQCM